MFNKTIVSGAVLLLALGQHCYAASIYTFSGQINTVQRYSGATSPSTYAANGIYAGNTVSFSIALDAYSSGTVTSPGGSVQDYPQHTTPGTMLTTEAWYRYASLTSSSIDMSGANVGSSYSVFGNEHNDLSYRGYIQVGSALTISNSTLFFDDGYIENWAVGDSLSFNILYGTSSNAVIAQGALVLNSISAPLPSLSTLTPVPVPGAAWLFGLSLAGLISCKRKMQAVV